jgi:hypothetical protein
MDTVSNRGMNSIVVGGDNTHSTGDYTDDDHRGNSCWRNFQTPHRDYEAR